MLWCTQTSKFNSNLVTFENQGFLNFSWKLHWPLEILSTRCRWLLTLRVSEIDREIKVSLEISRLDKHEDAREMNPSDTFMLHSNSAAKLYIPSTLNTDYLLWHTQSIVCAVEFWILGYYFHFSSFLCEKHILD